ncbi:MAG: hypothetical protein ABIC91_03290 [Nanoarchaeota archaeon]|nr:hypothetical protein [Nanoarchaeota archaeon]
MPKSGWGTQINKKEHGLTNFFLKNDVALKEEYHLINYLSDISSFIKFHLQENHDLLTCYNYGMLHDNFFPYGHASLIESIDVNNEKIVLADPHKKRIIVSVSTLENAIKEHKKSNNELGRFWVIY